MNAPPTVPLRDRQLRNHIQIKCASTCALQYYTRKKSRAHVMHVARALKAHVLGGAELAELECIVYTVHRLVKGVGHFK